MSRITVLGYKCLRRANGSRDTSSTQPWATADMRRSTGRTTPRTGPRDRTEDPRRGPPPTGPLARLQREFEFAHQLDHPHIVTMYEWGPDWLAMELVDGGTVANLPRRGRPAHGAGPGRRRARTTPISVASCIATSSRPTSLFPKNFPLRRGPHRLRCCPRGGRGASAGARHISRPRCITPRRSCCGAAALCGHDEYALACTAVELVTGSPPFSAKSAMALVDAHPHRPPPQISRQITWLPRAVDSILAKAMAKDPDNRYQSCGQFISLMTRALRS